MVVSDRMSTMRTSNESKVQRPRWFRLFATASFFVWATVFLAGCAHTRPRCGVAQKVISIPLPFDAVWPAVVQEANGVSTNSIADRSLGSVQIDDVPLHASWFSIRSYTCKPTGPLADWSTAKLKASFTVQTKSANETEVTVACRFYRFSASADDHWRRWPSNGRFEEQLLSSIAAHAAR